MMKKRKFLPLFSVLFFLVFLMACSNENLTYINIPAPSLKGNLFGESATQEIAVILPPNYGTSGKLYPVLYFLPGFSADHKTIANMLSNSLSDQAESEQDMIIVVVNGTSKLGGCFYTNSPVTGNWADFVMENVVSYIDSRYNTVQAAKSRGIAGHSMGGFGSLQLALNNSDVFGHVYSMSPGLFDEIGLENSGINFAVLERGIEKYSVLSEETAQSEYLSDVKKMIWPSNFAFAYASVFAYDTSKGFPYIEVPEKSDEIYLEDEVYNRYIQGFGAWEEKLDKNGDNFRNLYNLAIEYGEQDELYWIPNGSRYLCELLQKAKIPHEQIAFQGGHTNKLQERFDDFMLPFFCKAFTENN